MAERTQVVSQSRAKPRGPGFAIFGAGGTEIRCGLGMRVSPPETYESELAVRVHRTRELVSVNKRKCPRACPSLVVEAKTTLLTY